MAAPEGPGWWIPPRGREWPIVVWMTGLLVLAPIKLGCTINISSVAIYPLGPLDWLDQLWPPFLMAALSGVALLLTLLAWRPDPALYRSHPHLWLPYVALTLGALVGLMGTTEMQIATNFFWHLLGVALLALALIQYLARRPGDRTLLLAGILGSTIIVCAYGWYQHLVGFGTDLERIADGTIAANPAIVDRLTEGRIFATFTYPNNLAAHLLLVAPLCLYLVWRWSRHVDPPQLSQWFNVSLVGGLIVGAFLLTGSRAAIVAGGLAAVFTAGVCAWQGRSWLRRHRLAVAGGLAAVLIAGGLFLVIVQRQRGFGSASARLDYWRSAVQMWQTKPLTGVGMGEFFPWHLRLKPPNAEETRLPHNTILLFLSQCGLLGAAAALYFLVSPLLLWRRCAKGRTKLVSPGLWLVAVGGWLAWAAHSLADFNLQIPGTMLLVAALPILAIDLTQTATLPQHSGATVWRVQLLILALAGIANLWQVPGARRYQELTNHRQETIQSPADNARQRLQPEGLYKLAEQCAVWQPHSPDPWDIAGKVTLGYALDGLAQPILARERQAQISAALADLEPRLANATSSVRPYFEKQRDDLADKLKDLEKRRPLVQAREAAAPRLLVLAERSFAEAVRRTPHRPAYHAYLAQAMMLQDRTLVASALAERLDEARPEIDLALFWYPHSNVYRALDRLWHAADRLRQGDPDTAQAELDAAKLLNDRERRSLPPAPGEAAPRQSTTGLDPLILIVQEAIANGRR